MKKILDKLIDILIFAVLIISCIVMVLSFSKSDGLSNVFGKTILTVQTDSMEPTFYEGDLLISTIPEEGREYEVDDVVTFKTIVGDYVILNTHRIVEVIDNGDTRFYITKGDNADGEDSRILDSTKILAVWDGINIPKLGSVVDYLQSRTGFFICILLPMIIFFLYSLFRFIKNTIEYNKENAIEAAKEASIELTEEQKQKAIQEYLDNQKKNQE